MVAWQPLFPSETAVNGVDSVKAMALPGGPVLMSNLTDALQSSLLHEEGRERL